MEDKNQYVICPVCDKQILVPSIWWDKYVWITCRKCKTKWREVIPKPEEPKPEPTPTEEMLEGAKDFLSGLSKEARDFLYGSNSKK